MGLAVYNNKNIMFIILFRVARFPTEFYFPYSSSFCLLRDIQSVKSLLDVALTQYGTLPFDTKKKKGTVVQATVISLRHAVSICS